MESLSRLVEQDSAHPSGAEEEVLPSPDPYADFKALSDMFDMPEIDIVRKIGGSLQRGLDRAYEPAAEKPAQPSPRVVLEDSGAEHSDQDPVDDVPQDGAASSHSPSQLFKDGGMPGNLSGVYKYVRPHVLSFPSPQYRSTCRPFLPPSLYSQLTHPQYLLIRPHPSLRILFTSPTLRTPGTLQSHFLHRIGGSPRMRSDLETALKHRKNVTARVRWLNEPNEEGEGEGKARWIHCTPLIHYSGMVGLWMVVVVPPLPEAVSVGVSVVGSRGRGGSGGGEGKGRLRLEP